MNKSESLDIIKSLGFAPNKKLGQNFLINQHILEKIISTSHCTSKDRVLEIGPGIGALTRLLVEHADAVTAVELDSGFARYLTEFFSEQKNFRLIHGDFLKTDLPHDFTKVVANLPYYCSSEIIFTLARKFTMPDIYIMIQKEMADRITSSPGSRLYGAMSVTISLYFNCKKLFVITPGSFYPQPDVDSIFLHLERRKDLNLSKGELENFHCIVKSAFWGRRKKIRKSLTDAPYLDFTKVQIESILQSAGIDGDKRAEELSRDDYLAIIREMQ